MPFDEARRQLLVSSAALTAAALLPGRLAAKAGADSLAAPAPPRKK